MLQKERRLAKMVFVLLGLWAVAWTPYAVLACWNMLLRGEGLQPHLAVVPVVLCKLSGTLNGFIYGVRSE
jgi:hypothetical protein